MHTLLTLFMFLTFSQPPVESVLDITDDVSSAVKSGNAGNVAKFFSSTVDLKILDKEDVYSKAQAELILKDFLAKNTPKSFNLVHQGTSKEGAKYAIGTMTTTQNGTFRVYFLLKQASQKFYLQELHFEKE